MVKNEATRQLADDMIGAAQELTKAAARLMADARIIRAHGVYESDGDPCLIQRMHKHYDVSRAAAKAARSIGFVVGDFRIYSEDAYAAEDK